MLDDKCDRGETANPDGQIELAGATAVVTGSSSGIGRATAIELARAGAHVLVHARRNAAEAAATAQAIVSLRRDAKVVLCDLARPDEHARLVEQAWQWRGPVDIWINNAGADVLTGDKANWTFEQKLDLLWQVDVVATVRLSRLIGQRMKDRGRGAIVNIGWDQATQGMGGDSGELFSTIKGAVMSFTKSLAQSLAPAVRVNCVAPGWIKTSWGGQASPYWQQRAVRESLAHRWGTPEDVARVVRFLVAPAAGFISGQVIPVNGGFRFGSDNAE